MTSDLGLMNGRNEPASARLERPITPLMTTRPVTYVIEIVRGVGVPAFIPFTIGHVVQPFSVGKKGAWRVEAEHVADVDAFLCFDGATLFVASAGASSSVLVDGQRVGQPWTRLAPPCTIDVGAATLRFRALCTTVAPAKPAPPVEKPSASGDRDSWPDFDEVTRFSPLEPSAARVLAAHTSAMTEERTPSQEGPIAISTPNPVPEPATLPDDPAGRSPSLSGSGPYTWVGPNTEEGIATSASTYRVRSPAPGSARYYIAKYKELSLPKRILGFLGPLSLLAAAYLLPVDDEPSAAHASAALAPTDAGPAVSSSSSSAPAASNHVPLESHCPDGFVVYPLPGVIACVPAAKPIQPSGSDLTQATPGGVSGHDVDARPRVMVIKTRGR